VKGFRLQSSVTRFFKHTIFTNFHYLDKKAGSIVKCRLEEVISGAISLLELIIFGKRHHKKLTE
jgi:hypothetical protein